MFNHATYWYDCPMCGKPDASDGMSLCGACTKERYEAEEEERREAERRREEIRRKYPMV
jgi:uncharacterized Zn finger protein (UPF0148 family)